MIYFMSFTLTNFKKIFQQFTKLQYFIEKKKIKKLETTWR